MRGCLPGIFPPSSGAYRATSPQGGRLFRRDEVTPPYIAILPQSFLPRPYPINVRARRALRIYYLLSFIYYLFCPAGALSSPMVHRSAASREIAIKKQPYVFRRAVLWCTLFGTLPRANKAPLGLCCRSVRKATDTPCSRPRWCTCPPHPGKLQQKNSPTFSVRLYFGAPSGTRTQDPLIKSQLLSLVAHTHGVCCCNKKHFSNDQNH